MRIRAAGTWRRAGDTVVIAWPESAPPYHHRMMIPVPVKILPGAMSIFEWLLATLAISVAASF